jgi:hypothetical protein
LTQINPEDRIVKETWNEPLPIQDVLIIPFTIDRLLRHFRCEYIRKQNISIDTSCKKYVYSHEFRKIYQAVSARKKDFPVANSCYEKLFSGELGFILDKVFQSKPHIEPFIFDDSQLEETFWVFDHPTAFIFKKTQQKSAEELCRIFNFFV